LATEIARGEFALIVAEDRRHIVDRRRRKAGLDVVDHLGAAAEPPDTEVLAVPQQRLEHGARLVDRTVQLVADLARHALAQRLEPQVADTGVAEAHERDVAQAFAGRLLEHEQRIRPLQLQDELAVADLRRLGVEAAVAELVVGPGHAGPAGEEKVFLGEPHQHAFAHDLAGAVAQDDVASPVRPRTAQSCSRRHLRRISAPRARAPASWRAGRPVADIERVLPRHALVDPVGVLPWLERAAELRVGVDVARHRQGGARAVSPPDDFGRAHERRRREGVASATTPSITMRAYSAIMASTVEGARNAPVGDH
jgi:hypothetical protein